MFLKFILQKIYKLYNTIYNLFLSKKTSLFFKK